MCHFAPTLQLSQLNQVAVCSTSCWQANDSEGHREVIKMTIVPQSSSVSCTVHTKAVHSTSIFVRSTGCSRQIYTFCNSTHTHKKCFQKHKDFPRINLRWVIRDVFIQCKIIKYVLFSQNTTVLAKVVHGVSTLSTTCFGLYIGHRQVCI
jgi:hypothetical protein